MPTLLSGPLRENIALDVETERTLWQRASEREATFLVVSHRRAALARADRARLRNEIKRQRSPAASSAFD